MDNAKVFAEGLWGCALDQSHRRDIAVALGVITPDPLDVPGYDRRLLRQLGFGL